MSLSLGTFPNEGCYPPWGYRDYQAIRRPSSGLRQDIPAPARFGRLFAGIREEFPRGSGAGERSRACRRSPRPQATRVSRAPRAFPAPRRQIIAENQNSCDPAKMLQHFQDVRSSPPRGLAGGFLSPCRSRLLVFSELSRKALKSHDSRLDKGRNSGAECVLNDGERRPNGGRTGAERALNAR